MRRALLTAASATALAVTACGYADPYAGNPPVANLSPNPSVSPSAGPGGDDFGTCNNQSGGVTYPDGLKVLDVKVGAGAVARKLQNVEVQYTGWTLDGKPFDSSRFAGRTPFTFQVGNGEVIPGWDEGIPGMKIGGKRCLKIPPELGYGEQGSQDQQTGQYIIPPNATLVFAVELVSLKPGPSPSPSPKASPTPTPSPSPSASK